MESQASPRIPVDRPRPSIFAASALTLLAAVGLWVASAAASYLVPESGIGQDFALNALYYGLFVLAPIALYAARRRGLSGAMRLEPMPVLPSLTVILLALMSVYAASALDSLWTLALNALGLSAPEVGLKVGDSRALMLAVINSAAIPAICEELLFRGFVLSAWESRGTHFAIGVSTLFFGLLHGNLFGLPAYLMVGAISAYLVYSLNSIYAGIMYHTVYNAAILAIVHLLSGEGAAQPAVTAGLVGSIATELMVTLAVIFSMLFTLNLRRRISGIEPIPRIREPLRVRDRAMAAAALLVMIATLVIVLVEVQP